MNSQKVKVYHKGEVQSFDFDLIENLDELRLAISLAFDDLPANYDIIPFNQKRSALSNQQIALLRYAASDVHLYIRPKDQVNDIESIASDLSKIEILQRNESLRQQLKLKEAPGRERIQMSEEQRIDFSQVIQSPLRMNEDKVQERAVLNQDVQCNGCFAFPIQGTIYKCLVCPDFDLCSTCEESKHHYHPLLKIVHKNQYPFHLKAVFSKKSKAQMQQLEELEKANEARLKKMKYHPQVQDYHIIDPKTLPSKKVCKKNFISEIASSI